jgi:hypothetical protein
MGEPELREFATCIGENVVRSFRAVVQSDKKPNEARKLAILGDNGLRIFHVSLQSSDRLYSNSQPVTGYKIKKVERELPIAPNKELRLSYQRTTSIDTKLITLTKKHPRLLAVYIG